MRFLILLTLLSAAFGCAKTVAVQETSRLASQQLLRLETELHAATKIVEQKYAIQQRFAQRNLLAARELEGLTEALHREWLIAGDKEALRLYTTVLTSRPEPQPLPNQTAAPKIKVDTSAIKTTITDLGAIGQALVDREQPRALLNFVKNVQDKRIQMDAKEVAIADTSQADDPDTP